MFRTPSLTKTKIMQHILMFRGKSLGTPLGSNKSVYQERINLVLAALSPLRLLDYIMVMLFEHGRITAFNLLLVTTLGQFL
jgi:hypothetical protein